MSGNPARSSAAHLRAWGRDWDGSPMPEDAEPMPGLTVGHLYDAAALIEELERELAAARTKRRFYTELCIHAVKAHWAKDQEKIARIMAAVDVVTELWPEAAKREPCHACPPADAIADERRCTDCPWRSAQ